MTRWTDRLKAPRDPGLDIPTSKVRKRVAMLPTSELVMVIENTVSQVGKNVYDSTKSEHEPQAMGHLLEAETGAEALVEMVRELRARRAAL